MKYKMVLLGTVAAVSLAAASQSNAHNQGWYLGLEGGANWVDDNNGVIGYSSAKPLFTTETLSFDTGWAVLATVGYGFEGNWRLEFEAGWRQNDVDRITTFFGFTTPSRGELNELTLMANVLYDIPISDRLDFTIGVGAGVDRAELDSPFITAPGDDEDWNFAYQAIAGFSYAVSDRLDLTLQYRYLHVSEPEFNTPRGPVVDHFAFEDLEKHTVTVGLRYDLYKDEPPPPPAPPPPPPAPPVEEPDQFVIFFGYDKCNITQEADTVLSEAAAAYKSAGEADVRIEGHTDTMGSPAYNQRLSNCRAGAAAKNLEGKGVPKEAITAIGKGETQLLIKTGDQVKEPQNRRATVDIEKAGPPPATN